MIVPGRGGLCSSDGTARHRCSLPPLIRRFFSPTCCCDATGAARPVNCCCFPAAGPQATRHVSARSTHRWRAGRPRAFVGELPKPPLHHSHLIIATPAGPAILPGAGRSVVVFGSAALQAPRHRIVAVWIGTRASFADRRHDGSPFRLRRRDWIPPARRSAPVIHYAPGTSLLHVICHSPRSFSRTLRRCGQAKLHQRVAPHHPVPHA